MKSAPGERGWLRAVLGGGGVTRGAEVKAGSDGLAERTAAERTAVEKDEAADALVRAGGRAQARGGRPFGPRQRHRL